MAYSIHTNYAPYTQLQIETYFSHNKLELEFIPHWMITLLTHLLLVNDPVYLWIYPNTMYPVTPLLKPLQNNCHATPRSATCSPEVVPK